VLGAVVLLFAFAGPFTRGLHGPAFEAAVPLARILVVAALLAGAGNLEVQELLGRGASGWAAAAAGAALAVSVAGNLCFIPSAGALATAWTALASAAVLLAVTTAGVRRVRAATGVPAPSGTTSPSDEPRAPAAPS
jgi:O-antigen/teichoic acid export membrane protein